MIKNDTFEMWFTSMSQIYQDFFENGVNLTSLIEKNTLIGSSLKETPDEDLMKQLNMNNVH